MTKRPRDHKRAVCLAVVFVSLACLLYMELAPAVGLPEIRFSSDETMQRLVYMSLTRLLGAAAFLAVLITLGYRVLNPLRKPFGKALVFCIPAFLVAVNNAPLLGLATGTVYFTHTGWYLFWFIVECVAIGAFEELAFRGTVLLMITEKRRRTTGDLVIAILLSSAVFAVVHMVNLLVGADPGAVFLQIGYSFLIGAMCAVVLFEYMALRTASRRVRLRRKYCRGCPYGGTVGSLYHDLDGGACRVCDRDHADLTFENKARGAWPYL